MKRIVSLSTLLTVVALLMLLVVGAAAAAPPLQEIGDPDLPGDPEPGDPEPEIEEAEAAEATEAEPEGTAARIDFEIACHAAKKGHYSIQTLGGGEIASWYALDGWEDSGWLSNIDIGNRTVWVDVVYYPGPDTEPIVMRMLNHVPGETHGWVASGQAHALEVAWPDQPLMCAEEMADPNMTEEGFDDADL